MLTRFPASAALLTATLMALAAPFASAAPNDQSAASSESNHLQVVLEIRWITVAEDFTYERVGVDFGSGTAPNFSQKSEVGELLQSSMSKPETPVFLTACQVSQLLQEVQNDKRTHITQAPRLTLLNGQSGVLDVMRGQQFVTGMTLKSNGKSMMLIPIQEEIKTGTSITATPVISADQRSVRVNLNCKQAEVVTPIPTCPVGWPIQGSDGSVITFTQLVQQPKVDLLSLHKTVSIPDGGTVLLSGLKNVREVPVECCAPVVSRIPYLNRLFRNVGYSHETQNVVVLVTPRIVTREQEAKIAEPVACPKVESKQKASGHCCESAAVASSPKQAEPAQGICRGAGYGRDTATLQLMVTPRMVICEEEEEKSAPVCPLCEKERKSCLGCCATEVSPTLQKKVLTELLKAYDQACAEGRSGQAEKFALAALALDPMCFRRK